MNCRRITQSRPKQGQLPSHQAIKHQSRKDFSIIKPLEPCNNPVKFPSVKYSKIQNQNYILNEVIGEGSFAKVRLGIRKSDSLPCVIKIYEKYKINSELKRKGLKSQIAILQSVNHENIIKIIDSYETQESFNIVMQNFSRISLSQWVKENRPLSQQTLKKIVKQLASAIFYLHSNKISHRDLKSENILINSQGNVKIIDLGLAMMGDHTEMIVAGTKQFMCPQLINKKKFDPYRADIWSFGILLYWLALGYYPQDNTNKKSPSSLKKLGGFDLKFPIDIHPGIQYLIQKMLQTDPDMRINAEQILQNSWIKPRNIKLELQKLVKIVG